MTLQISKSRCLAVLAVATCFVAGSYRAEAQVAAAKNDTAWSDAASHQRANHLLKQMTEEEKVGQLCQVFVFGESPAADNMVRSGKLGSVLFMFDPAQINRLQKTAVEGSRLHIPLLFGLDVIHGFKTIFPVPLAMAASWDPALVERSQAIAAAEARSAGILWTFAPMVDIARDPRWGRIVEGAGEDPFLGAAMAAAQVRGFQGSHIGAPNHIVATAKHFAGYGAAEGGRDYDATDISDDQLRNVYFPPFKSAVDAGVGTLMSAYQDLNGVPATGNKWLLHDVLRDQWHFRGFVVSDSNAVNDLKTHGLAETVSDAAFRAFTAGVNMEMAFGNSAFGASLPDLLKQGKITVKQLDDAVRPILETKIKMGLFENPYVDEVHAKEVINAPDHREAAALAAERTAVLLRNTNNLLPLQPSRYKRIAVVGPLADSKLDTAGPWVFVNDASETVTVFDAIRSQAGPDAQVQYAQGVQLQRRFPSPFDGMPGRKAQEAWTEGKADQELNDAIKLAQDSDIAVLVLGEAWNMSGEGASVSTLALPGKQEKLLEAVAATGKPVVLVLMSGRPLDINWASQHISSILEAWFPGTEGGNAVANLLYGKAVPGGKLPFTWPRDVGQVPIFYAHNTTHQPSNQDKRYWNEESTPLYPFGYGLSYATFNLSNLQLSKTQIKKTESVIVSVDVENTSDVAADEVVQVYTHQQTGTSTRPVRELKGFQRVSLAPHQKKSLQFTLSETELTYWSTATGSWVEDASQFDVWAGDDATATLHGIFSVLP